MFKIPLNGAADVMLVLQIQLIDSCSYQVQMPTYLQRRRPS